MQHEKDISHYLCVFYHIVHDNYKALVPGHIADLLTLEI